MSAPRVSPEWPVVQEAAPLAHAGPHVLVERHAVIPEEGEAWWRECQIEGCTFFAEVT